MSYLTQMLKLIKFLMAGGTMVKTTSLGTNKTIIMVNLFREMTRNLGKRIKSSGTARTLSLGKMARSPSPRMHASL